MKELSTSKKIGKARYALSKSRSYTITIIILIVFSLIFPAGLIIQMFEKDYSETALIGFGFLSSLYTFNLLTITTVVPRCMGMKQRTVAKGNANMYDLFIQFPLTKKQVLTKAFKNWSLLSIISIATAITLCVIPMFYKRAQEVNSQIGFIVVTTVFVLITLEVVTILTSNCKFNRSTPFKVVYFFSLYGIFMFSMLCGDKVWFLKHIGGFDIFSGIVGVIILLCIIPLMWIITKVFLLDKKGKEAWHYEKIK